MALDIAETSDEGVGTSVGVNGVVFWCGIVLLMVVLLLLALLAAATAARTLPKSIWRYLLLSAPSHMSWMVLVMVWSSGWSWEMAWDGVPSSKILRCLGADAAVAVGAIIDDGRPLFRVAFSRERRLNCWDTTGAGKGGPLTMSTTEDLRWSLWKVRREKGWNELLFLFLFVTLTMSSLT